MPTDKRVSKLRIRALIGAIILVVVVLLGMRVAHAGELVPSIGLSKGVDGGSDIKTFAGVALRSGFLPLTKTEIAVFYRSESRFNDQLKVRMIPVTASLYLAPVSVIYAGGGVGWYHTKFDYRDDVPVSDETKEQFGVHLGGGFQVPLGPAALDLGGRYVMLRDERSRLVPEKFKADFWTASLGLAIKL